MPSLIDLISVQNAIAKDQEYADPFLKRVNENKEKLEQLKEMVWADMIRAAGFPAKIMPKQSQIRLYSEESCKKDGASVYKIKFQTYAKNVGDNTPKQMTQVISKSLYDEFKKYIKMFGE